MSLSLYGLSCFVFFVNNHFFFQNLSKKTMCLGCLLCQSQSRAVWSRTWHCDTGASPCTIRQHIACDLNLKRSIIINHFSLYTRPRQKKTLLTFAIEGECHSSSLIVVRSRRFFTFSLSEFFFADNFFRGLEKNVELWFVVCLSATSLSLCFTDSNIWLVTFSLFSFFFCFVWLCYTLWYHDFCRMRMVTWPRGILHLLLVRTIPVIINWKYQGALVWRQLHPLIIPPSSPISEINSDKTGNIW